MSHYSVTGRWQHRWADWCKETFGKHSFMDVRNRVARVVEEAAELGQSEGLDKDTVYRIVERVYSRDVGQPKQEAAGVFITLLIYCASTGVSILHAVGIEWRRVQKMGPDHFRKKQREKFAAGTDLVSPV